MKKLAIVSTHPIQYNAPWFRLLAQREKIVPRVFYTWSQSAEGANFDPGFGKVVTWDIPLLDGYEYTFVDNISEKPGTGHFGGIDNPSLVQEIEEWKPDAILLFGWNYRSHLRCIRHFHKRLPILFRGDSTLLNERPGIKKWLRRVFLKWVYGHVDFALYTGEENKKYFTAHGLKKEQLIFAPHAIDNERFQGSGEEYELKASAWRNELGFLPGDLVVLFAGKLESEKNPFFLLKLAAAISNHNIKFLVVGNGVFERELKEKAAADKRFRFLDFQNQQKMPLVYRLGDVFLLPSVSETWGLAVNEAMACRRPVIVSQKVGCAPDLVFPGDNGLIISPGETADCSSFLELLASHREKINVMGASSAKKISSYSFVRIVEAIEGLLLKL